MQETRERNGAFINNEAWPILLVSSTPIHTQVFELISEVRSKRNENGISPKLAATIAIHAKDESIYHHAAGIIQKLANVENISPDEVIGFKALLGTDEISIGFKDYVQKIDVAAIQNEIKRLEGFLIGIDKKLGNASFISNAHPDVIAKEEQKKADTMSKIASLTAQLASN